MVRQIVTIAMINAQEAVSKRVILLVSAGLLMIYAFAVFMGNTVSTQTEQIEVGMYASLVRLFLNILVVIYIAASITKQYQGAMVSQLLSMAITRESLYLGQLIGISLFLACLLSLASIGLLVITPSITALWWLVSLSCELLLVAALTLFIVTSVGSVVTTVIVSIGFYSLARMMEGIGNLSTHALVLDHTGIDGIFDSLIPILEFLLPPLYAFSNTDWLIDGQIPVSPVTWILNTVVFVSLFCIAGIFDLYRKQL